MQEKVVEMLKDYEEDFKVLKITKKKLKGAVECFLIQEGLSEECIKVILKTFTIEQYINFIEDMGEINSRDWLNILIYNELIEEK